jgi:hypothetical protein
VTSPSSRSGSSSGGSSPASDSPCVPPGTGPYIVESTLSGGPGCEDGSGTYGFYWSDCDAGELCPYGMTTNWPPGSDEECSLSVSSGTCQATCFSPIAVTGNEPRGGAITYQVTPTGFSGTATATTADAGTCTYAFTATAQ